MNKALVMSVSLLLGVSTSAIALESRTTMCVHDNQTRIIEIVYEGENNIPCEVKYTKEDTTQTLWRAQNKAGYCENKAAAFVEKQIGWGWSCDLIDTTNTDMKEETVQS